MKWALPVIIGYLGIMAAIMIVGGASLLWFGSYLTALVPLFVAVLYAGPAWGLHHRKRWARYAQLILSLAFFGMGLIRAFTVSLVSGVVDIIPHGLIAAYLLTDHCIDIFRKVKPAIPPEGKPNDEGEHRNPSK